MQNNMTFTAHSDSFTTSDGVSVNVIGNNSKSGYWLNGVFYETLSFWPTSSFVSCSPAPADNKTEKAFHVAKSLIANKRVTVTTPAAFIALVEELAAVL